MKEPQPTLHAGDRVSAYEIERLVGAGGMGWVFCARHLLSSERVALKVLRDDQLTVARSIDRMMGEAAILASIDHAGVPTFYECGILPDRRPWIAMELVEGTPLTQRIRSGLGASEVIDLIGQIAGVLAAAHDRGVTHRDLKPDNVFLTPADPSYPVRLIDWGIAHQLSSARHTDLNEAIGTPTYMAPEQAHGQTPKAPADIYGLGVLAYVALAGKPPFTGRSGIEILVQHMRRQVPPLAPRCPHAPIALTELVERMLAKSVDTRPTAGEVCNAVARLQGRAEHAYPVAFLEDVTVRIAKR